MQSHKRPNVIASVTPTNNLPQTQSASALAFLPHHHPHHHSHHHHHHPLNHISAPPSAQVPTPQATQFSPSMLQNPFYSQAVAAAAAAAATSGTNPGQTNHGIWDPHQITQSLDVNQQAGINQYMMLLLARLFQSSWSRGVY